ncbi:hypothetical protein ACT3HK_14890 [Thermolongibacillus altinsuensis]|jgi:hypothetical protein
MSKVAEQTFYSADELYKKIEKTLQDHGFMIYSRKDHDYHFIIEIGTKKEKLGRLKVYYNKFFKCSSVQIIDPIKPTYYTLISELLPIKKVSIIQPDFFMEYLKNNYRFTVSVIHDSAAWKCYEICFHDRCVWVRVGKGNNLVCQYVNGDIDFFDEIHYIYEEEIIPFIE